MKRSRAGWLLAVLTLAGLVAMLYWRSLPQPQSATGLVRQDCPADFDRFIDCVQARMREAASAQPPLPPRPADLDALTDTARQLHASGGAGRCAVELPPLLRSHYRLQPLQGSGDRYCALYENKVDTSGRTVLGWGTLIVATQPVRALDLGAPHPRHDLDTALQASALFSRLGARSLVMAGSHREADVVLSRCGGQPYHRSDASHNLSGYFALARAGSEQAAADQSGGWFLEWHGMATPAGDAPCFDPVARRPLDVYITEGAAAALSEGGFAAHLIAGLRSTQPDWRIGHPGDGVACDLHGSSNLLARFLNSGAAGSHRALRRHLCTKPDRPTASPGGQFIHIEQLRCVGGEPCAENQVPVRSAAAWQDALRYAYDAARRARHPSPR